MRVSKNWVKFNKMFTLSPWAMGRLCNALGGLSIEVPLAKHIDRQLRNREIMVQSESGKSRTQLAKEFDLGTRQVANIKRKMREQ
ncbi:Mor transcription activator family protein [Aeromonas salmonicida]|uniref:Mor transcription activator family protein n=1 Tax=Aeromonas salmonicida TaxID=645 RepID=UPI0030CA2A1F